MGYRAPPTTRPVPEEVTSDDLKASILVMWLTIRSERKAAENEPEGLKLLWAARAEDQ
jgi:hypothetical protein